MRWGRRGGDGVEKIMQTLNKIYCLWKFAVKYFVKIIAYRVYWKYSMLSSVNQQSRDLFYYINCSNQNIIVR